MRALPMLGVAALAAAVIAVAPPPAAAQDAPTAHIQLETRQAYAELPFNLVVVAEGFDDDPAPEQPSLQIAGATVTPLGVEPRVQQSIQVVNGRRFESRETDLSGLIDFMANVGAPSQPTDTEGSRG